MTGDDLRSIFLRRLAQHGKAVGASIVEIGFADDCYTQFNYSKRQQKWIDALREKYEEQVNFLETGIKTLGIRAMETANQVPIPVDEPSPRARRRQAKKVVKVRPKVKPKQSKLKKHARRH